MKSLLLVFVGGGFGSVLRYLISKYLNNIETGIPYGTFETGEDGRLLKLQEKPELNYLANTGVYLLEPHLLKEIPSDTFFHITHLIEKILKRNGKVGIFPVSEKSWTDIGNCEDNPV